MTSLITEFNRNAIKITIKEKENNLRVFSEMFVEFQVLVKNNLPFYMKLTMTWMHRAIQK